MISLNSLSYTGLKAKNNHKTFCFNCWKIADLQAHSVPLMARYELVDLLFLKNRENLTQIYCILLKSEHFDKLFCFWGEGPWDNILSNVGWRPNTCNFLKSVPRTENFRPWLQYQFICKIIFTCSSWTFNISAKASAIFPVWNAFWRNMAINLGVCRSSSA